MTVVRAGFLSGSETLLLLQENIKKNIDERGFHVRVESMVLLHKSSREGRRKKLFY